MDYIDAKTVRKAILAAIAVIGLFVPFGFVRQSNGRAETGTVINLAPPALVSVAKAEEGSLASFVEDEAGISCYFQASTGITLDDVSDMFRTIEARTADYILGSIPVPEYRESQDVHVYIHTDGWVLAYYLKADPTGKIFDWRNYAGGTTIPTKLENVLLTVAGQIGEPTPTFGFYHFQYPNATHLMLIAEVSEASDSFEVNLTGDYGYYERSWSLGGNHFNCCWGAKYYLDDVLIESHGDVGWYTSEGLLTASQLSPDTFHVIRVDTNQPSYGGLALVYRVP